MFLRNRFHSLRKLAQFCTAESVSGKKAPATSTQQTKVERNFQLQFSKSALVDFGELPTGEIPEALKYDRPQALTQLDTGLRVVSEYSEVFSNYENLFKNTQQSLILHF